MNSNHSRVNQQLCYTMNTPLLELTIYRFPDRKLSWSVLCKNVLEGTQKWSKYKTEKDALSACSDEGILSTFPYLPAGSEKSLIATKHNHSSGDKISKRRFPLASSHFNSVPFTNTSVVSWYINEVASSRTVNRRKSLTKELYKYIFLHSKGRQLLNNYRFAYYACLKYYTFFNEGHFVESKITPLVEKLSNRLVSGISFSNIIKT